MNKSETANTFDLLSLYDKSKKYIDIAYRSGLILYMAYMCMSYTRLSVYQVAHITQLLGTGLLILSAVCRVFFELFKNLKRAIFAILLVLFSFVCYFLSPNCEMFPVTAFAIVGAIGIGADQILTVGIIGNVIMIINNILMTFSLGQSPLQDRDFFYLGKNVFYVSMMNNFSCTDFASHYLWIIAAYLWIRGKKLTWGEWFALLFFDFVLYSLTGSNTSFLCIGLALFFAFCLKLKIIYLKKKKSGCPESEASYLKIFNKLKSMLVFMCKYSFVILSVICITLSVLYDNSSAFFLKLNSITNKRFSLAYRGLYEYGVHLFAKFVPSYGVNSSADGFYNFVDCSYLNILIRFGIVLLVFYVAMMTIIQLKQKKYVYGVCILTVLAISCIEEHHLVELPYNFFLILLFSDFDLDKKTDYKELFKIKKNRNFLVNSVCGVLCVIFIGAFVFINLPRVKAINELDRLDKKAGDIYQQLQIDIDSKVASGVWDKSVSSMSSLEFGDVLTPPSDFSVVTGSKWADAISNPKQHSFYSVKYDPAYETDCDVIELMISDEVKAMVGDGSIVVEYDVVSGRLYSVWFAETSGCYQIENGRNTDRSGRLRDDVLIREGYYTG